MPEVLGPKIIAPETPPTEDALAAAKARGTVYAAGIKELEELWADGSGAVYLKATRVSERAITRLAAFELGHRLTSFRTSQCGNTPVVISEAEQRAFLEGWCEVLPGPYPAELPRTHEDGFVAKHDVFHSQAVEIRKNHRDLVLFLETQITDTLRQGERKYSRELTLFEFAAPEMVDNLRAYV